MEQFVGRYGCLFSPLEALDAFRDLTDALRRPGVYSAYGPDDAQRAHLIAAAVWKLNRPALVIVPNEMAALRMTEDLNLLLDGRVRSLPARELTFLKAAASSHGMTRRRMEALGDCATGKAAALVLSADAMMNRLMPADRLRGHVVEIDDTMRMEPAELMEKLTDAGYERVQLVEARGQCALRGGILDVYPVGEPNALRIEFFDDEINSIRSFDVMTQRSVSPRPSARLYPATETLLKEEERLLAAGRLSFQLRNSASGRGRSRQKQLESQFDLTPFEDFLRQTAADEEAGASGRSARSAMERNFAFAVDALQTAPASTARIRWRRCCWTTRRRSPTIWTIPSWCWISPSGCASAAKTPIWSSRSSFRRRWSARRRFRCRPSCSGTGTRCCPSWTGEAC